ncbi:MAG: TonB-dependent receptor [Prolixibacteraceae bacterium]|nr:TonB-dependent receptor [Prolixibacteraceae bacterium]
MAYGNGIAQNDCGDITLNSAKKNYEIGNFNKVIESLELCIDDGFNYLQEIEAYKMLAIANLAIDSINASFEASTKLLEINPSFEPDLFDPPGFIQIINSIKTTASALLVTSVSKKAENVLKAPATVIIITEEEIINRGYIDVEQVFHDLPGFDISKGQGANYSNLYQRGYRSIMTDRTLLLVDGVEQNDLVSDNAQISRQYPLSNIKRIEVIYGPASTMYGANAFVGVVNIVTKTNDEILNKDRGIGGNAYLSYGSMNSKNLDAVIVAKNKNMSFSITGKYFKSDEINFSLYDNWKFNLNDVDYFQKMNLSGLDENGNYLANNYIGGTRLDTLPVNNLYNITYNSNNEATNINLTGEGAIKANSFDNSALNPEPGKNPVGVDASSTNWYIKGKLQLKDFTFAIESWKTDEGIAPWYSNERYLFRKNHTRWISWNSNFYVNFEKQLSNKLLMTNLTSYRLHSINGATNFETYRGYFNGSYSFYELATDKVPVLETTYYYRASNQIKNELRFLWFPLSKVDIMAGIEFRSSLIQGDYLKSSIPDPDENGKISDRGILGADHFRSFDLGIYAQATGSIAKNLNCVLGGRVDNNRIRQNGGYGTVFNPRIALIYSPGQLILKAIYATAFKDASYMQKYATVKGARELPNPTLEPEKVKNAEISLYWKANENLSFDVIAYNSYYSDVVGSVEVTLEDGTTTGQFQPIGEQQIYGSQANAKFVLKNYSFWFNYTYTNPIDKVLDLRISDIASHQYNFGINAIYMKNFNINLRSNYVGNRLTGEGTSGSNSPLTVFDRYMLFHLTIGYRDLIKGLNVQVGAMNLLDKEYFDPGVREAIYPYASEIPQSGRTFMLKILYQI